MQCKCGGIMSESTHKVRTLDGAREWYCKAKETDLPVTVNNNKCACTRVSFKVYSNDGRLLRHQW